MNLEELKKVPGYEKYSITPDGQLFNHRANKWSKPYRNKSGYYTYRVNGNHMYAHRLVALTYLGKPPKKGYEVDHIDENKGNNHFTNLQWISHADNVRLSFTRGNRNSWWKGKTRPSPSLETRRKMSNAKNKPIHIIKDGKLIKVCESVNATAEYFQVTRVTIFTSMRKGEFRGYELKPA